VSVAGCRRPWEIAPIAESALVNRQVQQVCGRADQPFQCAAWGWGLTTTTPGDQISRLRELLQCNAQLTGARRERAFGLLENVTDS
jgi:hypothetical protein